ncbi:MAG: lipopolysaccharide kinase [Deltaproteobacteria bacterium]|nr:lipopolysaccharide kinase [Deltaproteobacteria bacterium]
MEFINPAYQELLARHRLLDFNAFWSLPEDWYEEPNNRRRGWSGVSIHRLPLAEEALALFVKRQENHNFRSPTHPGGRPTFYKEFRQLLALKQRQITTPPLVYYGERRRHGRRQAVLATIALAGYCSLDAWLADKSIPAGEKSDRLEKIGRQIRKLHDHRFQHRALYGKHLLVNRELPADAGGLAFIDLEKTRRWPLMTARLRASDLAQLLRHSPALSGGFDRDLLRGYCHDRPPWEEKLLVRIEERLARKNRRRPPGEGSTAGQDAATPKAPG